jgi:hypothetical protein
LVAVKVEIDPSIGATAFGKSENLPVKTTCLINIVNRKCDVKWGYCGHHDVR